GKVTRQFDRIMEQATKVKAMRGEVPLTESAEAMEEASYRANNALNEQIAAIRKLGMSTEEGAAAANKFISSMMPLVKMLGGGPAGLQYRKGEQIETIQASPEKYVSTRKNLEQQMFAIRDVLGKRPASNVNIEKLGAVFTNLEVLNKVMEAFSIRLDGTGESAEEAMQRLEKLKEGLVDLLAAAGMSRSKPGSAAQRSAAQAMEGGASRAPYATALEFPTDVSGEMAAVSARLREMKDAGHNVDEALSAFERMTAIQKPQGGIPRDVLLINKSDWENLIRDTAKKYNIPTAEAEERLRRPGLMQRSPITGPASFLPAQLRPVGSEMVPPGNLGVAGPAAISSAKDLENMLAPLRALKAT
ncbi:MAG: hypothetical protein L0Y56_01955, partial [Nitrospira sp.]|nr:hypothetical protein [Nitrospira sp.]